MRIHCSRCGRYVGTLKGKIRLGTTSVYICKECDKPKKKPEIPDLPKGFKEIFNL